MPNRLIESLESRRLLSGTTWPSASVQVTPVETWEDTKSFTVTYDSALQVRRDTLDNRDIKVVGPNGFQQLAKLDSVDNTRNSRRLTAQYSVTPPSGLWSATDNGEYQIFVNAGQVRDLQNNPTRTKLIGSFIVDVPKYPSELATPAPPEALVTIPVRNFGAIPNDAIDDTAAIQAAIASLPLSAGVPNGITPIGGTISFEAGEYRLSQKIRISSGVWLRGVGDTTVLRNTSPIRDDTAIQIFSAYTHGGIFGARVEDLRIVTTNTRGIQIDPTTSGDVNNIRLRNLTISAGNIAIDCRPIDVYQSMFADITIENPGAAAMWLRADRSNSAINIVQNMLVRGPARTSFDASEPLFSLGGQMTLDSVVVQDIGRPVMPIYIYEMRGSSRGVKVQTNTANLLNGEMMRLHQSWLRFDRLDGLSANSRIRLISTKDLHIDQVTVATGATLDASLVTDSMSHVTVGTLMGGGQLGSPVPGRITVREFSELAAPLSSATPPPSSPLNGGPVSTQVVNVFDFGAITTDTLDDTVAIQAAIDSLPLGNGIPGAGSPVGGTVLFPLGTYLTSAPLRVPSGVWLVGNAWGTTVRYTSPVEESSAIVFTGTRGMNIGAGVVNFGIYTTAGAAIRADSSVSRGLIDMHIANVAIASASKGIDLRDITVQHSTLDSIFVRDPHDTSLWLGDRYSTDNRVSFLQVAGNIANNTPPEKAHVILVGETRLEYSWLEFYGIESLPLYLSGNVTIRGLWCENHLSTLPDDVIISFEDVDSADIDMTLLVDDTHKLKFRNAKNVHFQMLDIAGSTPPLDEALDLDATSQIRIDTVNAIFDAGMLDDPRVSIGGVYNQNAKTFVDTATALTGRNLIADPSMTSIGAPGSTSAWWIQFGDPSGQVFGYYSVEQTASGTRLKVVVTSDPNNRGVRIDTRLLVTRGDHGLQPILRYRVDGPNSLIGWGEEFTYQYAARVNNSTTAVAATTPISSATALTLLLPGGVGTYYISNVGLIANS